MSMTENEAKKWMNTLKNLNSILPEVQEACRMAEKCFEEIQQYRAIGTVEEFKALKEKNEPKRLLTKWEMYPTNHGVYSSADRWCPSCKNLVFDGDWSVSKQKMMYNRHRCECGQVLDWR